MAAGQAVSRTGARLGGGFRWRGVGAKVGARRRWKRPFEFPILLEDDDGCEINGDKERLYDLSLETKRLVDIEAAAETLKG